MDWISLVGALFFFTFLVGITLAFASKQQIKKRMDDENATKSTLAADKSSHGTPADV